MKFQWDENKNQQNIKKRQIDFVDAVNIFLDPFYIEEEDTRQDYGEPRYKVIGEVNGQILVVVYTYRVRQGRTSTASPGEKIRIISARKAQPYERRKYYQNYP